MLEVRFCRAEHMMAPYNIVRHPPRTILHNVLFTSRTESLRLTLAMSYMTEILNSQSMKASSGYETLSFSTYWKQTGTEGISVCMYVCGRLFLLLLYMNTNESVNLINPLYSTLIFDLLFCSELPIFLTCHSK